MVAITRQRRRARQRRTTIRRITSAIRTCSVLVLILGVSIYLSQVPLSDAFFTAVQPVNPVSFRVTTEIRQATVNIAFDAAESRLATDADHVWAEVTLGNDDYDLVRVNESTIEVLTEDLTVIPVVEVQPDSHVLRLRFSRQHLEQLLWHGNHSLTVTGEFMGGWVQFSGTGTLSLTIPALLAVEELEALPDVTLEDMFRVQEIVSMIDHPRAQELLQRLGVVEQRLLNRLYASQLQIALEALEAAEKSKTQDDYDRAAELIAELPEGEEKDALLLRLSEIEIAISIPAVVEEGQRGGELVGDGAVPAPESDEPPVEDAPEIDTDVDTEYPAGGDHYSPDDNVIDDDSTDTQSDDASGETEDSSGGSTDTETTDPEVVPDIYTEGPAAGDPEGPSDDDGTVDDSTATDLTDDPVDDSDDAAPEVEADTDDNPGHGVDSGDEGGSGTEIENDIHPATAANREDVLVEEEESEEKGD